MDIQQTSQHSHKILVTALTGLLMVLLIFTGPASAGVFLQNGSDVSGDQPITTILSDPNLTPGDYSIVFFYNTHCGACHLAMTYLNEYNAAHPEITITSYDLFNSSEGKALFEQYKESYHRQYVSVPSLFIGNAGLEGESAIRENFEELVAWHEKSKGDNLTNLQTNSGKTWQKNHRTVISIPLVLIAGLVDGINPCASAVLIFLLILLMSIRQRQRILLAGIVFASAVYFMYFISGTGIYRVTDIAGVLNGYSLIVGIIAVVAGMILIWKGIEASRNGEIQSPDPKNEKILKQITEMTIPLSFVLGLVISVLELSCTGGIYWSIQDMISFRVNITQGLFYLFLYNLVFIVPLLIITLLVYWWVPTRDTEPESNGEMFKNKIFLGLLLLVFAFLTLSGVV
ncbi:MAG: hypothetical protein LUQ50_10980 [Methanospirillum sp.]|uniref:cytochrome c biogenesis CcdA family protein n=1 Tax=Methanospirillum sp. TaxID=45200 RepID=UPI00236F946F|nr:hypothetical protein [Methanospirillum sp.]MDD1729577.1 hypothetical protein [Methanospirillum sp.]